MSFPCNVGTVIFRAKLKYPISVLKFLLNNNMPIATVRGFCILWRILEILNRSSGKQAWEPGGGHEDGVDNLGIHPDNILFS